MGRDQTQKKAGEVVAVVIDNDKGSQHALKWTVDSLVTRGQALTLLHVIQRTSIPTQTTEEVEKAQAKELFLPFRCFCNKKLLKCNEVIIEDINIAKALVNYVVNNSIDILVLGAPSRSGLLRFKTTDVPNTVSKKAPSFCIVYVIGKGKISYMRAQANNGHVQYSLELKLELKQTMDMYSTACKEALTAKQKVLAWFLWLH